MNVHCRLWRYRVEPTQHDVFVQHYSGEGTWAKLFAQAEGYLGTSLWQDAADVNVFYTQDRWRSEADFEHFQRLFSTQYHALDRELEGVSGQEEFLGACRRIG